MYLSGFRLLFTLACFGHPFVFFPIAHYIYKVIARSACTHIVTINSKHEQMLVNRRPRKGSLFSFVTYYPL